MMYYNTMFRLATEKDLPRILEIYEYARGFMRKNGNSTQWAGGYPKIEMLRDDIAHDNLYVFTEGDARSKDVAGTNACADADTACADTDAATATSACANNAEKIHGVFAFIIGEDATYKRIDNGAWLSDTTYGTIHRIASSGEVRGVFAKSVEFCKTRCPHLRIDTHADNLPMQHLIEKCGFSKCGIIYTYDGSPRLAYELVQ